MLCGSDVQKHNKSREFLPIPLRIFIDLFISSFTLDKMF